MGNTINPAELVKLSQQIYKEWHAETVLVQSCDNAFENELNLKTRELDIPVYHDISIHRTTLKERELKPAPIEFLKSSTVRVTIDKGRYSHWGDININEVLDKLTQENSETRKKLIRDWAEDAETELAEWCAKLPKSQTIDLVELLAEANPSNANGIVDKDSIFLALDILKAHVKTKKMSVKDFKLFASEKLETVIRDSKMLVGSNLDANEAFTKGFVGYANGVDVRNMDVASVTTRNSKTKMVDAEWAIWKTRDGIQYVVPYRNTISYEISPNEVLTGGTGYQTVEYYDFFNIYKPRLYKVKIRYSGTANPPTFN